MAKPVSPVFPRVNVDAIVALQRGNVETALQAQRIVSETTQAVVKLHTDWLREVAQKVQVFAKPDVARKPDAIVAEARAVAERAFAVARQEIDLSARAQSEVVNLLAKRAAANIDQVKAFAAAA